MKRIWFSPGDKRFWKYMQHFFQSPSQPMQKHFLVSARGSVMWEVAWYRLTIASGKPSTNSFSNEELVFGSERGRTVSNTFWYGITEMDLDIYWLLICCLSALIYIWNENMTKREQVFTKAIWLSLSNTCRHHDNEWWGHFPHSWLSCQLSSLLWNGSPGGYWQINDFGCSLSVPTVIAHDALKIISSFHMDWVCRSGVHKANFHF